MEDSKQLPPEIEQGLEAIVPLEKFGDAGCISGRTGMSGMVERIFVWRREENG